MYLLETIKWNLHASWMCSQFLLKHYYLKSLNVRVWVHFRVFDRQQFMVCVSASCQIKWLSQNSTSHSDPSHAGHMCIGPCTFLTFKSQDTSNQSITAPSHRVSPHLRIVLNQITLRCSCKSFLLVSGPTFSHTFIKLINFRSTMPMPMLLTDSVRKSKKLVLQLEPVIPKQLWLQLFNFSFTGAGAFLV